MRQPLPAKAHSKLLSAVLLGYDHAPNHPCKLRLQAWIERALGNRRLIRRVNSGYWMALDRLDFIQRSLAHEAIWEPGLTRLFAMEFRSGDVFWDAGANTGYFTLMALKAGVQRVVSFEPDPLTVSILELNLRLNDWSRPESVEIVRCALGAKAGAVTFGRASATNTGMSGIGIQNAELEFEVEMTTLDRLFGSAEELAPTILKIDVEGLELAVLEGGQTLLAKAPPRLIVFEADRNQSGGLADERLEDLLSRGGYSVRLLEGDIHGEGKANFVALHGMA